MMGMRALARRVRDAARTSIQRVLLHHQLATLDRTLRSGRQPQLRLLEQLERSWGNEAWSAGAPFLSAMLDWLPQTSGAIAECGSGLSTLVLASAASRLGRRVHSFEHDRDWAACIARDLPARLRPSVELNVTPIKSYGEFDWYSLEAVRAPTAIGFVVCDGPPGTTRGGRYGLAPVLRSHLAPGCIVLLDDTQRPSEREILGRWCAELGGSIVQEAGTYSVLAVGRDRSQIADSTGAQA
jgi:hypothetical protein